MEKQLPAHLGAEQEILGSILYAPEKMQLIADRLQPGDFYYQSYRHPEIFMAMRLLYEHNQEINTLTVEEKLAHLSTPITEIQDRPAHRYLTDLWEIAYYAGRDIESATGLVLNLALKRKEYQFLFDARDIIMAEEDAGAALEKISQLLYDLDQGRTVSDLMPGPQVMLEYMNALDHQAERGRSSVIGVPSGFDDLDALLGGFQRQELAILGGRPGTGKSSLMLSIVHSLIFARACKIAIFSLEMSRDDLARRLVSMESGIDSQRLRLNPQLLQEGEWDRIVAANERLSKECFSVDESGELTIAAIRSKARRQKMKHGLDFVIVDYLQLMSSDTEEKNRVVEIGKISRGLKRLAKDLDVPVLALASLSRAVESRLVKRPQLSDLRESGSIESDADLVMFISINPDRANQSILEIAKHRHGPTGEVDLYFEAALTRFRNLDEVTEAEA